MHKKKSYGNKRIDNWLIHIQDLIPQIMEIKYRRGIENIGPDYLTRCDTIDTEVQQQTFYAITRSMNKQGGRNGLPSSTMNEEFDRNGSSSASMNKDCGRNGPSPAPMNEGGDRNGPSPVSMNKQGGPNTFTLSEDLNLGKIKSEQDNDKDIQIIISRIQDKKRCDEFVLYNDLLYRLIVQEKPGHQEKSFYTYHIQ